MSDKWCEDRIEKLFKDDPKKIREITNALRNGEVDKVLSKVDELGNVTTQKLDSAGNIIGNWLYK